jgi:hypothetical protein
MDVRRLRFAAALTLFALWVLALGVMAAFSGRKPPPARAKVAAPASPSGTAAGADRR